MNDQKLFPVDDFERWANHYDRSLQAVKGFPLEGYWAVLERLVQLAQVSPAMRVLDLGCGTGNLTALFAGLGCRMLGSDFSPRMLAIARAKLPQTDFVLHDLNQPLLHEMDGPFERIVSAYTFHHFPLSVKVDLLTRLAKCLSPGGVILMADVSFETAAVQQAVRVEAGPLWEDEYYWLADETLAALAQVGLTADYEQVGRFAGIYRIGLTSGE